MTAQLLFEALCQRGLMLSTAESCTGGMVAAAITDIAGSSKVFERGFVTYSNESKADMLGVPATLLEAHGAVSEQVARAMAAGAIARSRADISVAITGVAGPGGGSPQKPVGLVHFACATRQGEIVHCKETFGNLRRDAIRALAVSRALQLALEMLGRNQFI